MLCIPGETRQQNDDYEHAGSWGNDNVNDDGPFDNGNDQSDAEDTTNSLISQPRQVCILICIWSLRYNSKECNRPMVSNQTLM